jgi:hypothetical protein
VIAKRGDPMENRWSYKEYEIEDGLKPASIHFQYYFTVSHGGQKKSNYCVWIEDEALSRFDLSKDFDAIVASQREGWNRWVKGKIDEGDFRNKVLKFEKDGEKEIDLSEMPAHLSME